jgi:Rrf2 family protein
MLGKTTEYAIRAMVYIYIRNMEGKRPSYKEIAKKIDSPEQFTGKVLQNLAKAQLLASVKGKGGGFYLGEPSNPLTLFEVIRAVEGDEYFSKCGFGLKNCDSTNPCPMHDDYSPIREAFFQLVHKQTIQILASKVNQHQAVLNRLEIT